jgi:hypothetical protein
LSYGALKWIKLEYKGHLNTRNNFLKRVFQIQRFHFRFWIKSKNLVFESNGKICQINGVRAMDSFQN